MGVQVIEGADSITVKGGTVQGGKVDGANDHRIVMAFAVAAAYAQNQSEITHKEAVSKSYPEFFKDFNILGGKVNEF